MAHVHVSGAHCHVSSHISSSCAKEHTAVPSNGCGMWAYIFPARVPRLHANYTFIASYRFDVFNWLKLFWVFQLFLKLFWFFNCLKLIWTFLNDQSCLNSLFCELTCPCCAVGMPTAAASCTVAHWTPAHRVTSRGHVDSIRLLWSWSRSQCSPSCHRNMSGEFAAFCCCCYAAAYLDQWTDHMWFTRASTLKMVRCTMHIYIYIVSDAHANYTPVLQTTTDIASQRIIGACYLHLVITC